MIVAYVPNFMQSLEKALLSGKWSQGERPLPLLHHWLRHRVSYPALVSK